MAATASGAPAASASPPRASAPNGCEPMPRVTAPRARPRSSGSVPCSTTEVCSTAKEAKPKPPTNRTAIDSG